MVLKEKIINFASIHILLIFVQIVIMTKEFLLEKISKTKIDTQQLQIKSGIIGYKKKIKITYKDYPHELYISSLISGNEPTISTCTDKTKMAVDSFRKIHGNLYDYTKFKYESSGSFGTITCKIHGDFKQRYSAHKQGQKCLQCAKDLVRTYSSDFIKECKIVHNYKYSYKDEKIFYRSIKHKIDIRCPIHGVFKQAIDLHRKGQGCNRCKYLLNNKRFEDWSKLRPNNPAIFYILKCWNEDEEFYKLGITCKDNIKDRYCGKSTMPYNYQIIYEEKSFDRLYIWNKEVKLKKLNSPRIYKPIIKFNGSSTECFKTINYDIG